MRSILVNESSLLGLAALFLLAAFGALALAPAARLAAWQAARPATGYVFSLAVWLAVAIAGHLVLSRRLPKHDPLIFPIVMLLSGWGMALVWRLAPAFGLRQTVWLCVASLGMHAVVFSPADLRWLRRYRYLWLVAGLSLTALTLLIGINPSGSGPALWLGIANVFFQPSEALKLFFVIYLAAYLSERVSPIPPAANDRRQVIVFLAPLLLVWGLSLLILVSQRDLGTGSLIFTVFIVLLYLATGQSRYVLLGSLLLLLATGAAYGLFDVVRIRVDAWINPFADPGGRSFQIVQSLISVANGGLFGRGFGVGAPTVIPVVHSDFAYAAIVEEWGLFGGLAALVLILILVTRGLRLAFLAHSTFRRLVAGGLAALIGLQSLLIVAGVIKVLPLTGVTLPFLSYGGSSLLTNFVIAGLLLKLSDDSNR